MQGPRQTRAVSGPTAGISVVTPVLHFPRPGEIKTPGLEPDNIYDIYAECGRQTLIWRESLVDMPKLPESSVRGPYLTGLSSFRRAG